MIALMTLCHTALTRIDVFILPLLLDAVRLISHAALPARGRRWCCEGSEALLVYLVELKSARDFGEMCLSIFGQAKDYPNLRVGQLMVSDEEERFRLLFHLLGYIC